MSSLVGSKLSSKAPKTIMVQQSTLCSLLTAIKYPTITQRISIYTNRFDGTKKKSPSLVSILYGFLGKQTEVLPAEDGGEDSDVVGFRLLVLGLHGVNNVNLHRT